MLDADIAFRARTMAGHGVGAMIEASMPGMRHEQAAAGLEALVGPASATGLGMARVLCPTLVKGEACTWPTTPWIAEFCYPVGAAGRSPRPSQARPRRWSA
ncbi:MAG: hypothetical protein U0838_07905 [Chloroflexota bacterium]